MAAVDQLQEANPNGRFWLKLDATDLKEALMESMKGVWNGDVDLGDGKLQELRDDYDGRVNLVISLAGYDSRRELEVGLKQWIDELDEDVLFLDSGFNLKQAYEEELSYLNPVMVTPQVLRRVKGSVRGMATQAKAYLRNLFKKRRTAATHVLVLMLSDERRQNKPYALPVRFVPYRTLRDQYVRDFTREMKQKMTERGLHLVGEC